MIITYIWLAGTCVVMSFETHSHTIDEVIKDIVFAMLWPVWSSLIVGLLAYEMISDAIVRMKIDD